MRGPEAAHKGKPGEADFERSTDLLLPDLDFQSTGFLSDFIFYALGVIVAILLPVVAYMCASVLFVCADKATSDGMPTLQRVADSYGGPGTTQVVVSPASASGRHMM